MKLLRPALALGLAAALASAPAAARSTPDLWATVNLCNTPSSPNAMGVRARMPGDATRERMYMRFAAQYQDGKQWKAVSGRAVSRWFYAGSALFRHEELGYTFSFDAPKPGAGYVLRGLVQFQWRARQRVAGRVKTVVVRHSHAYTRAGHPTGEGDPPDYSAATCQIGTTSP